MAKNIGNLSARRTAVECITQSHTFFDSARAIRHGGEHLLATVKELGCDAVTNEASP